MNLTHQVWFVSWKVPRLASALDWQQLCTGSTFFCTFICRCCTTATWNCLISLFMKDVNTTKRFYFYVYFFKLRYSLFEFNSRKVRQHLTIERDGIRRKEFETGRVHFRETFSLPSPSLMLKGLFVKRWWTLGEWRNPPVHIISHFNLITFTW